MPRFLRSVVIVVTLLMSVPAVAADVRTFTDANFASEVLGNPLPVLVYFTATWSALGRAMAPKVAKVAADHDGKLIVGSLDSDHGRETVARYNVEQLPYFLIFFRGRVTAHFVGPADDGGFGAFVANALLHVNDPADPPRPDGQ